MVGWRAKTWSIIWKAHIIAVMRGKCIFEWRHSAILEPILIELWVKSIHWRILRVEGWLLRAIVGHVCVVLLRGFKLLVIVVVIWRNILLLCYKFIPIILWIVSMPKRLLVLSRKSRRKIFLHLVWKVLVLGHWLELLLLSIRIAVRGNFIVCKPVLG